MNEKRRQRIERAVDLLRNTRGEWAPIGIEIVSTKELAGGLLEIIETGHYVRRVVVGCSERASVRRANFEVVK